MTIFLDKLASWKKTSAPELLYHGFISVNVYYILSDGKVCMALVVVLVNYSVITLICTLSVVSEKISVKNI